MNSVGSVVSSPASSGFATSPPAPETFSAIAPPSGSTTPSDAPTLHWSQSLHATQYIVEIGESASLETPEITLVANGVDAEGIVVPSGLLQEGQTYYWRVTSLNSTGFSATDTDIFEFVSGGSGVAVPGIPVASISAFWLVCFLALTGTLAMVRRGRRV